MFKIKISLTIILLLLSFQIISAQSLQELQQLRSEYEKMKKNQLNLDQMSDDLEDKTLIDMPKTAIIEPYLKGIKDSVDIYNNFFGYSFFARRDTIAFWESLPTPANYLLGPGDELVISLWGETMLHQSYTISREGKIYDNKIGLLNLMGKNIQEAEEYISNQFGRIYATLRGNNPSTYMDISLGQLRSINVNFVGEVKYPGVYPIHPFSTIITGLIQAGGVDTTGSLRNIQIKRLGESPIIIDLYDYLIKGDLPKNIQLRDQDIVAIPVRSSWVKIDSAIVRPGIYESKLGETVADIIDYSGGLLPKSSSIIGLKRVIPIEKRQNDELTLENYYINYSDINQTKIQNGDEIIVRKIFQTINKVEIIGQVKKPGIYHYYQGMKLKDLFELGGGFNDSTFWKSIYQLRGEVVRRNPQTRYESVIEVNLNDVINDGKDNLMLENLDRFVVHANLNFFEKENVQILGEVNVPGSYPLISDNETLNSLLSRAGELTSKALINGIAIYRDKKYFDIIDQNKSNIKKDDDSKVRVAWKNDKISLMPGDSIVVKEKTGTVNVTGEVYNPGLIEYSKGKSLRYYLNSAGGLNDLGNNNGIVVIYANGVVIPKRWYSSPKIEDGSTIKVNQMEPSEPMNLTQFATNWTSIISSMITAIVLSQQLGGTAN